MPLSFLHTTPTERVEVPISTGEFQPSGLIAPFVAAPMYWVMSNTLKRADLEAAGVTVNAEARKGNEWTTFYFLAQADAIAATQMVKQSTGIEYDAKRHRPNQAWRFETRLADVLNVSAEHKPKFCREGEAVASKVLTYETEVVTLRAGNTKFPVKNRHTFHLIALPAAVAAVARALGHSVEFDLSELISDETVFDDAFAVRLIGSSDGGYQDSVLWQRRVALWKALGEDDPVVSVPTGYGMGRETSSPLLSQCLTVFAHPWAGTEWVRLLGVNDPRVDAVYNDNRLKVSVIADFFNTEADARAAAEAELAAKGGDGPAVKAQPPVPAAYAALADDWVTYLRAYVAEGKPNPVIAKEMSVTPGDVSAWREHLSI